MASSAADWAENTYRDSNAKYFISSNTKSTKSTYCSKLVWQVYYYGTGDAYELNENIIPPYELNILIFNLELVGKYKDK